MSVNLKGKIYRNTQEQVLENSRKIEEIVNEIIPDDSITTAKLQDGAVTTVKIHSEAINSSKIEANAITASKIATGAVTTNKINDGAVTTDKLDEESVTTEKLADDSVTNDKIVNIDIEKIIDKDDHNRFVEGNGIATELAGYTPTYVKWSLSGSHLMFVVAGNVTSGTTLPAGFQLAYFELPSWILDKIYPVFSGILELKTISFYDSSYQSQTKDFALQKSGNYMSVKTPSTVGLTMSSNKSFRVQYDLLIDNE